MRVDVTLSPEPTNSGPESFHDNGRTRGFGLVLRPGRLFEIPYGLKRTRVCVNF